MKRRVTIGLAVMAAAFLSQIFVSPASAADAPGDRTVVMYFHRTQRCPTCLKMGSYSEEAVKSGFAQQTRDRTVEFHYIDFQDEKNAALTKGYGITGPALIVAKVENSKVKQFKNLEEIWSHVADKPAFLKYVQENVAASLK